MIEIALIISLATLGFRSITGKGMLLYILRKPFDKLSERKKGIQEEIDRCNKKVEMFEDIINKNVKDYGDDYYKTEMYKERKQEIQTTKTIIVMIESPDKYDWLLRLSKPLILCSTCMASVHTLIWYPILTGTNLITCSWTQLICVMLMVALINTLIWALIELIQRD